MLFCISLRPRLFSAVHFCLISKIAVRVSTQVSTSVELLLILFEVYWASKDYTCRIVVVVVAVVVNLLGKGGPVVQVGGMGDEQRGMKTSWELWRGSFSFMVVSVRSPAEWCNTDPAFVVLVLGHFSRNKWLFCVVYPDPIGVGVCGNDFYAHWRAGWNLEFPKG